MFLPILATKLYISSPRPTIVLRPRLVERLNEGLSGKLTLISAPAGFGKTTLVSEWIAGCGRMVAWLSLDEGDGDPARFLMYFVAALQTLPPKTGGANIGAGVLAALQSPQPPSIESILTTLLNEISAFQDNFVLVLDDYHVIDSRPVDEALTFLLKHLPPQVHLVITTREDPHLPLAHLRARGQLSELRAADLRFTPAEAAEFLNRMMGLDLSAENIAALETRTEGWIAGLQLAALALQGTISIQGHPDAGNFIKSFTGSHHFVLDYLVEEVLQQQSEGTQAFLLATSILESFNAELCAAVNLDPMGPREQFTADHSPSTVDCQLLLEYLDHSNLFIVSLDNERRWYRYHHLFGDLLRQRLGQNLAPGEIAELHIRASEWYEKNNLAVEAFHHAAAANDIERAERLIESGELPLHFRAVVTMVLDWLASLPPAVLDARPLLRVRSATLALMAGQTTGVEEKLQAAEAAVAAGAASAIALRNSEPDARTRDLIGQVACAQATLALTRYDLEAMLTQAHRALEYLHPENLTFTFTANWALATAFRFQGDRAAAAHACRESIAISEKSGVVFSKILAYSALGELQELDNQLYQAAETYRWVLELFGEHPQPHAGEVHLGLARIHYEWNEPDAAEQHGLQSLQLTRQYDRVIDRFILSEVFLARLKLAQGEVRDAEAGLAQTEQTARQKNFLLRLPDIAAAQVLVLLRQGRLAAAAQLARQFDLPLSQARVFIAQGNPSAALDILGSYRQQMEAHGWAAERLMAMVLQAVALHLDGNDSQAAQALNETLALAEPGGFIRLFVDEGGPMLELLSQPAAQASRPEYVRKLITAFGTSANGQPAKTMLVDPLSQRELEVLRLIAEGLTNQEIGERLFLAIDTVKGYNRRIFDKLQVQRRTEAIARARELDLL